MGPREAQGLLNTLSRNTDNKDDCDEEKDNVFDVSASQAWWCQMPRPYATLKEPMVYMSLNLYTLIKVTGLLRLNIQ